MEGNRDVRICTLCLAAVTPIAIAEPEFPPYPSSGLIYNQRESNSLVYGCEPSIAEKTLHCDFTQVRVVHKTERSKIPKILADAMRDYEGAKKELKSKPQACDEADFFISAFKTRKPIDRPNEFVSDPAEFNANMENMTPLQVDDILASFNALKEFCVTRTKEAYERFVRIDIDKSARTCQVSSNKFEQTFVYVSSTEDSPGSWVVKSGDPGGPCGFVQLSRFVIAPDRGSLEFLWNYVARRATTNPEGTHILGSKCSDFDQETYVFDWKPRELPMQCDYIEFSAL